MAKSTLSRVGWQICRLNHCKFFVDLTISFKVPLKNYEIRVDHRWFESRHTFPMFSRTPCSRSFTFRGDIFRLIFSLYSVLQRYTVITTKLWNRKTTFTVVSAEVNISINWYSADIRIYHLLDKELDRKIYVTAMQFLLVQNRHQTHDWTLIGSGANELSIQQCFRTK